MDVSIDVVAGAVRAIPVPVTSTDIQILSGDGYICGWSLRDAQGTIQASVEGTANAPGAGGIIVTTPSLPALEYQINWEVGLNGTVSATEANNFELTAGSNVIVPSINPPAVGDYPQPEVFYMRGTAGTFSVKAIAAATAASVYSASIAIVPVANQLTVVEFQDGALILGEASMSPNQNETRSFGQTGLELTTGILLHVVSGTVTGTVYARYLKASNGC